MSRSVIFYAIILSSMLLSACAVKMPVIHHYSLDNVGYHVNAAKTSTNTLLISIPEASAGFRTAQMAYSQQSPQLNYYAYHQWAATPADMMQDVLLKAFNSTNAYRAVITPPSTAHANLQLDTRILQFYQEFAPHNINKSRFIVQLQISLLRSKDNRIMFNHTYQCQQPVLKTTPFFAAKAANIAVHHCVAEVLHDIIKQ